MAILDDLNDYYPPAQLCRSACLSSTAPSSAARPALPAFHLASWPAHARTAVTVPMLATLGWDQIDLLKIDIEGYEKTLFQDNNSWLSRVRLIIGEAHGTLFTESTRFGRTWSHSGSR